MCFETLQLWVYNVHMMSVTCTFGSNHAAKLYAAAFGWVLGLGSVEASTIIACAYDPASRAAPGSLMIYQTHQHCVKCFCHTGRS